MAFVSNLSYNLQLTPRINWTTAQEKTIVKDYPFTDLSQETPDQYVQRTYLQFLWLPDSIMPLNRLVPAMRRVNVASGSSQSEALQIHPLHELLDPLLHTPRSAANKYHQEVPKILADGGGAGEVEEMTMWYALSYEKGEQGHEAVRGTNDEAGVWEDEKWRTSWLQRMERREVQIQILLHFLLLSLPGPAPAVPPPPPELSLVKRRKQLRKKTVPPPSTEDRLESFMDKLSTWQLMRDLSSSPTKTKDKMYVDDLDWMQQFCQDVVEPQFKLLLPEQCALLRSKVFPESPFTDDEDDQATQPAFPADPARSSSLEPRPLAKRARTISNLAVPPSASTSNSRYPSPALSTTSSRIDSRQKHSSKNLEPRKLERSRSLSISLAEEERERRRAASTGPSRLLNREVSMSRSFKNIAKAKQQTSSESQKTAVKSDAETKSVKTNRDEGVTLVEATPAKPKEARVRTLSRASSQALTLTLVPESPAKPVGGMQGNESTGSMSPLTDLSEEEEWQLPGSSSPAKLFLPGEDDSDDSDDELRLGSTSGSVVATPTKARKGVNRALG
ncbi:hypothetical protein V5O48_001517 [Marasmius crinis-equi]|uniref:DNA replication regulator Sld3 C-terminal domain-containing protein n=1 Tax=Marasmius crinis-equi TaxID=585013 RepID=A0ABR3FYE8_9AGAR